MNTEFHPNIDSQNHSTLDSGLLSSSEQIDANGAAQSDSTRARELLIAEVVVGAGLSIAAAVAASKLPISALIGPALKYYKVKSGTGRN